MKVRLVGAESLHADGRRGWQTDMTELIVAVRNFAKGAKKTKAETVIPTIYRYSENKGPF